MNALTRLRTGLYLVVALLFGVFAFTNPAQGKTINEWSLQYESSSQEQFGDTIRLDVIASLFTGVAISGGHSRTSIDDTDVNQTRVQGHLYLPLGRLTLMGGAGVIYEEARFPSGARLDETAELITGLLRWQATPKVVLDLGLERAAFDETTVNALLPEITISDEHGKHNIALGLRFFQVEEADTDYFDSWYGGYTYRWQ